MFFWVIFENSNFYLVKVVFFQKPSKTIGKVGILTKIQKKLRLFWCFTSKFQLLLGKSWNFQKFQKNWGNSIIPSFLNFSTLPKKRWNDGILEVFFGIVGRQTECVTRYASRAVVCSDRLCLNACSRLRHNAKFGKKAYSIDSWFLQILKMSLSDKNVFKGTRVLCY